MKLYAMFTKLSSGWRFEGFTKSEHVVQKFIQDVNIDVEETRSNTVFTKTLGHHITELDNS